MRAVHGARAHQPARIVVSGRWAPQPAVVQGQWAPQPTGAHREWPKRSAARGRSGACWALPFVVGAALLLGSPSALAQDAEAEAPAVNAAVLLPGSEEQAAKLEQATKLLEQLSYTEAQQQLFDVVRSGQATPEQLSQAYFNLGIVEATLGNEVESTDAFYLALMIQPGLLFPSGGSPKIRERLNAARSRVMEVGVLEARANVSGGKLEVHIDNDPLELVKRIEVVKVSVGDRLDKTNLEKGSLSTDIDASVNKAHVVLYDEAGNQLKIIDVDPSAASAEQIATATAGGPSVWKSWGVWAGVAGALALGSTYFMMESSNIGGDIDDAQNEAEPDQIEIARLEDDRDRVALYGVVGFSMAGAAAVAAGILLLTGDDTKDDGSDDDAADAEASIAPSFAPGHLGAQLRLRF
jgi:hypothetical protein